MSESKPTTMELMQTLIDWWDKADAHCDLLGYVAGEYDNELDMEGVGLREGIREARNNLRQHQETSA